MVFLVGVGVQRLELASILEALLTEEEIVAIFTHPTMLEDLSFAGKALVPFVQLHLRLKNDF